MSFIVPLRNKPSYPNKFGIVDDAFCGSEVENPRHQLINCDVRSVKSAIRHQISLEDAPLAPPNPGFLETFRVGVPRLRFLRKKKKGTIDLQVTVLK